MEQEMNYQDLNSITKKFLINEGETSVREYIQSLSEILNSLNVTSQRDVNRLKIASTHIREIRRRYKRLEEKINLLEEKLSILEETSAMSGAAVAGHSSPENKKRKKNGDQK